MTKEELNGTKVWCETNEISEKVQIKLFSLGILWANTEDKVQKYKGIIIRDYLTEDSFKSSFDKHNHKEITPSQLLGETECHKFKIGDIVRRKKGSGPNNMIGELTPFTIEGFRSDGWILHDRGYHRPDYLEIVPQEEVEYWECIKDPWPYKILGLTCKIKDKKAQSVICNVNGTYEAGTQLFVSLDLIHFKPSTREAYEAQQKGQWKVENVKINVSIEYPDKEVNKCSTINTNQNECKNENKNSKANDSMDSISGGTGGQEIRLRTKSVRVVCESGFAKSGREVSKTRRSSKRPKAETGRRFI
jgi:hypothetical protein